MPNRSTLDPARVFVAQQPWFELLAPGERAQALAWRGPMITKALHQMLRHRARLSLRS